MKQLLQESSLALLEQGVMRLYLEDFYRWTQSLGGYTAEMMGEILKTKADTLAINLILSSFGTAYNEVWLGAKLDCSRSCGRFGSLCCRRSGFYTRRDWRR